MKRNKKCILCLCLSVGLLFTGCGIKADERLFDSKAKIEYSTNTGGNNYISSPEFISSGVSLGNDISSIPNDESITAGSALIVDETGENILYQKDMYKRIYPASVTKVMTALLVLENCDMKERVKFSHEAANITEPGAVLCGFDEGDKVSVKNLLYCLLIFSGNDAAYALAEHVGGSIEGFSDMMNNKARELGCADTHFVNSNGLHDPDHYTTAYDMYLIFRQAIQYDLFQKIISTPSYVLPYKDKGKEAHEMTVTTTNSYVSGSLQPPGGVHVVGGKTGTTSDAGSCLALYSRDNDENDYISIVFKASSSYDLYSQMNILLSYIRGEKVDNV